MAAVDYVTVKVYYTAGAAATGKVQVVSFKLYPKPKLRGR